MKNGSMRRARRCAVAASLTASALLAATAAPAAAAEGDPVTGWWSQTRVGAPSPVEAPVPIVPDGGTWVAGGADAVAVSALRLELADDVQATGLSLEVADVRGEPVVTVCPAAAFWVPVEGGRFEEAPPADCSTSATGTVQDGRLVVDLSGLAAPGTLDVVLQPAENAAFSLTMQPATAASVQVVTAADEPEPVAPPEPASEPAASGPSTAELPPLTGSTSSLPPFDPPSAFASAPLVAAELPALAAAPPPAAVPPQAAGPVRTPVALQPSAAAPATGRDGALLAAALLVGVLLLGMRLGMTPVAAPRALGGAARLRGGEPVAAPAVAAPLRGVGRFRHERAGRPTPL
jgi:hypothetical protein